MPKAEIRYLNGYRCIYAPDYPRAMENEVWAGYVYEHIVVAEQALGRPMFPNEVVHHLDFNRANNARTNLLVLDRKQHTRLHEWIDRGAPGLVCSSAAPDTPAFCPACGRTLQPGQNVYCGPECQAFTGRKVERPSAKELECLMATTSWSAIGRSFGVSDTAVRKWAKAYGLL